MGPSRAHQLRPNRRIHRDAFFITALLFLRPSSLASASQSTFHADGNDMTSAKILRATRESQKENTVGHINNDPRSPALEVLTGNSRNFTKVEPIYTEVEPIFYRRTRRWDSIVSMEAMQRGDRLQRSMFPVEQDPFKFTEAPSAAPSKAPSAVPTLAPSAAPSAAPTSTPSRAPSMAPSASPTSTPTFSPTENMWQTEPQPRNPSNDYFDYRPGKDERRGVEDWDRVSSTREEDYWKADNLNQWIKPSLGNNRCGSGSKRQSPIDVRLADAKGQCFEYHQIRSKPGEYSIEDPIVKTQILPSKLRFIYPRNFGDPSLGNDMVKGASADIPKGWGHQLPVTHVDIKIPSEHWMEGKQYAAEYQIYLIQNKSQRRGAPAISILLDIHPENKMNKDLQIVLDEFQNLFDADMAECKSRRRRQRRLGASRHVGKNLKDTNYSTWLDEPEEEEVDFQAILRKKKRRAQRFRKFNPWSSEIMRSVWFYGYEGSLTEPPCAEFVEWRIIDTPGLISVEQLHQMKKLLFHHVDKNCQRTSIHYEGSVARPLQPYNGRYVHRCMCRDFIGDDDRDEYGENRCLWKERDQFGFDKEIYTNEWFDSTHKYQDPKDQPD